MYIHLCIHSSLATAARWRSSPPLVSTNPEQLPGMVLLSIPAAEFVPRAPALPSTHRHWAGCLVFPDSLSLSQFQNICERSLAIFSYPGLCVVRFRPVVFAG